MIYVDVLEPRPDVTLHPFCLICGAGPQDGHWSMCPMAPAGSTADTDPDADDPEQSVEFL